MKTTRILTILALALCLVQPARAADMGTAFTYQGHLYDNNDVANGPYDFQFKLYNDDEGEDQLCRDVNIADVDVIDSYFTVELDFNSPDVDWEEEGFNGQARWLEVGIRPGELEDSNEYTILSPRQEITPVPYALHAVTAGGGESSWNDLTDVPAGFADNIDNDSGGDINSVTAGTGLTGGGTEGDVTLSIADSGVTTAKILNGTILFGDIGQNSADSGQIMKWNGSAWAAADDNAIAGGGDISAVIAGTGLGGGGTSGDVTLSIADNGVTTAKIEDGTILFGDIGQNSAGSNQVMKWNGSAWAAANDETGGDITAVIAGTGLIGGGTSGDVTLNLGAGDGVNVFSDSVEVYALQAADGNPTNAVYVDSAGKVGIGTTQPADYDIFADNLVVYEPWDSGITVVSDANSRGSIYFADGTGGADAYRGFVQYCHGIGGERLRFGADGAGIMSLSDGKVGIGTSTPGAKLEVDGDLKVTGAYKGNLGPGGGAPFPRPAYDSDWQSIAQGETKTLTHNIGGNIYNYVVDMQFKDTDGPAGIHNSSIGLDNTGSNVYGGCWRELTTTDIKVYRGSSSDYVDKIRVRIWYYN